MKKLVILGKDGSTIMTFAGDFARDFFDQVVLRSEDFVQVESRMKGTLDLKCIRENTFSVENDGVRVHVRLDYVIRYTVTP